MTTEGEKSESEGTEAKPRDAGDFAVPPVDPKPSDTAATDTVDTGANEVPDPTTDADATQGDVEMVDPKEEEKNVEGEATPAVDNETSEPKETDAKEVTDQATDADATQRDAETGDSKDEEKKGEADANPTVDEIPEQTKIERAADDEDDDKDKTDTMDTKNADEKDDDKDKTEEIDKVNDPAAAKAEDLDGEAKAPSSLPTSSSPQEQVKINGEEIIGEMKSQEESLGDKEDGEMKAADNTVEKSEETNVNGDEGVKGEVTGEVDKTSISEQTKDIVTTTEPDKTSTVPETNPIEVKGESKSSEHVDEKPSNAEEEQKANPDVGATEATNHEVPPTTDEKVSTNTKQEDGTIEMDSEMKSVEPSEVKECEEKTNDVPMSVSEDAGGSKDDAVVSIQDGTNGETKPNTTMTKITNDLDEAFKDFRNNGPSKKKKRQIKIKIAGMATKIPPRKVSDPSRIPDTDRYSTITPDTDPFRDAPSNDESFMPYDPNVIEMELEDSLKFFEEPHEDQDPAHTEKQRKEKMDNIAATLKKLREEEESGKRDIVAIVNQQLKERQQNAEQHIEKHRQKTAAEHNRDMTRLQQAYSEKSRSNQGKIDQGVSVLRKKHSDENQKYMQQHRQQVQQRRVPEHVANAEWAQIAQRLNAKHSRQMHEFSRKGKEVMNKYKLEFEREQARLTKVYEKRVQDLNGQRQTIHNRIHSSYNQLKQRHVKRHAQSIAKRRQTMESELATYTTPNQDHQASEGAGKTSPKKQSTPEKSKSDRDEKVALRPVSPIKTAADWRKESTHDPSGAATRHKHRKGVLSQINRQLSVEIHNEGIWLSEISESKTDQNKKTDSAATGPKTESDQKYFFPWGFKARKILESIVCGEIPHACESLKLNFSETVAHNGGHVRCVMTDLRTSDATASSQRAEAIMKREIDELKSLEEKDATLKSSMAEIQKATDIIKKQQLDLGTKLKETLKDLEKTKLHLQAFRTKYSRYFGSDGKPLPTNNPDDTRKLTQAGMKYKVAIESSEKRAIAIKAKMSELQASLQKRQQSTEQGNRASVKYTADIKAKKSLVNDVRSGKLNLVQTQLASNATTRVKDTINILELTADMRREQLNQKRNSNTSSNWVQSLPDVPGSLRRSLWYKMHRRRQQIVLRPTFTSMLTNMRSEIGSKLASTDRGVRVPKGAIEDELIKAEQAYLLATHPLESLEDNIPSIPSSSVWAEPGWHLKLDVEKSDDLEDRILPCPPKQDLVQHNLSELYSAPGSQAASMINSTHLRSLETPLSAVATATSLAETDPAMAKSADPILSSNDPLRMTRDVLKLGYSFTLTKTPVVKPTVTRRKSSSSIKDVASPSPSTKTKKRQSASTASASAAPKSSSATTSAPSTSTADKSRKRKSSTQAESSSAPRAAPVQRQQRVEPPRPAPAPVDDQAFQPRPIMTQPKQIPQPQPPPKQQQPPPQKQPTPSPAPYMHQPMPQQQQNPYSNQFMNAMPSPVAAQQQVGHRGSFNQYQNPPQMSPQMNQFRMMQQQQQQQQPPPHHQPHRQQQQNYGQMQQQAMRANPQFFPQMGQQQFPQQPMQMPGQVGMQMNPQGNNQGRPNMASADEQHDPLFMLKDMH